MTQGVIHPINGLVYEVRVCGMRKDVDGSMVYCDPDLDGEPDSYSTYVRYQKDDGSWELLDDLDFDTLEEAETAGAQLAAHYGADDFETY